MDTSIQDYGSESNNSICFSGFSVGFCMNEEGYLLPTIARKKLADVLTECFSRHQGESEEV